MKAIDLIDNLCLGMGSEDEVAHGIVTLHPDTMDANLRTYFGKDARWDIKPDKDGKYYYQWVDYGNDDYPIEAIGSWDGYAVVSTDKGDQCIYLYHVSDLQG